MLFFKSFNFMITKPDRVALVLTRSQC